MCFRAISRVNLLNIKYVKILLKCTVRGDDTHCKVLDKKSC